MCQKFNWKYSSALCSGQELLTGCRGSEKQNNATPGRPQCEQEAEPSLPVVAYSSFVSQERESIVSAPWMHILHFVSCLWCCSLGVTLPLRFRLDLCLGGNVPSQPGMTTAWRRHDPPRSYTERQPAGSALMKPRRQVHFLSLHISLDLAGNLSMRRRLGQGQGRNWNAQFVWYNTVGLVGWTAVKGFPLSKHCALFCRNIDVH